MKKMKKTRSIFRFFTTAILIQFIFIGTSCGQEGKEGSETDVKKMIGIEKTYDKVRNGLRMVLKYDATKGAFVGTVKNISKRVATEVRVEVHLSNGTELGPTPRVDVKPGKTIKINLSAKGNKFNKFSTHAETGTEAGHGSEGEGGESHARREGKEGREGGEGYESNPSHPEGNEGEGGHDEGGKEENEAAMSSPIIPLNQKWEGVIGGIAVSAEYNARTKTVTTMAKNIASKTFCFVQTEPHLKYKGRTVGELGPGKLGDLKPGKSATSRLKVANEPELKNVKFDGYTIHIETSECGGSGPIPHESNTESYEGRGESHAGREGREAKGGSRRESKEEHGGEGREGREAGSEGKGEENGNQFGIKETYSGVRRGVQMTLKYNAKKGGFVGKVKNVTTKTIKDVRVEVHLSNGVELGPTQRADLAPRQTRAIFLSTEGNKFKSWSTHAESGEEEGHGSEGKEGRER